MIVQDGRFETLELVRQTHNKGEGHGTPPCHTQEEIAEAVGYSREAIKKFVSFGTNADSSVNTKSPETDDDAEEDGNALGRYTPTNEELAASRHETNFKVPLYKRVEAAGKELMYVRTFRAADLLQFRRLRCGLSIFLFFFRLSVT
jgi:hypothetical protein